MSKQKKYEMKVMEDGYEDGLWQKFEEEKQRQAEEEHKEKSLNFVNKKNFLFVIVWGLLYKAAIRAGFGLV